MAELDKAEAAAREALERYYESEDYGVSPAALRDLLAALDAARGEAVPDGYTSYGEFRWACDCDERMKREWTPLYAAPPAALWETMPGDCCDQAYSEGYKAALAQQPAAAVPEGYALVPVEPTQAMLDAAGMCVVPEGKEWLDASNREVWHAMLAAANKENNND